MAFFICVVPVCPVRAEASHRSEQVSQLLFGEPCELVERTADFVKIRVVYDNYEGWCQATQLLEIEDNNSDSRSRLAGGWVNEIMINDQMMHVPFASTLPMNDMIGKYNVEYKGVVMDIEKNSLTEDLLNQLTSTFINTPYQWGGRSVFGVDCSGFTQVVFKCMNIPLLRDASQQATQGDEVGFLQEAKPGDLAFFDNDAGKITHVGILMNPTTIIHSAGKVRKDTIDTLGIISGDTGKRTHKLRLIKRVAKGVSSGLLF